MGLSVCEQRGAEGRDGEAGGKGMSCQLGTKQGVWTCICISLGIENDNPRLRVSKRQGERTALSGVSSIKPRCRTQCEERVPAFSNWKRSQDVYNFMDGRTPTLQTLNGGSM